MTELKVEPSTCREEEVVLDEQFRKRMTKIVKQNKKLLEKLAKL